MKKILIIQNKRIGDVLIASIIANNMKKVFPESHISFFVYDYTSGVLENNPNIDRIIQVKEKELKKIPVLLQTIWEIRRRKYDIIFDPYGKLQSRLICLFSGAPVRVGLRSKKKKMRFPVYTHPISAVEKRTSIYGRAIEDRIKMITSVFKLKSPDYEPKLFLLPEEKEYPGLSEVKRPIIMLGILGSTAQKSLPLEYIVKIINYITANYQVTILFNYIPFQKSEAIKIYEMCDNKEQIITTIYEDSIRGFIRLMNQCDMLIANEGGSVHIAKALKKPTFTVYSPYISKEHWNSFEDGITHDSVHLLEENPDLFAAFSVEERRKIEKNPKELYLKLTPEMILKKLKPFLQHHLK